MVEMNRRNFLTLATIMLSNGRLPNNVFADVPLDSNDVKIASWVRAAEKKTVEEQYRMDNKGNEHKIGSTAFYTKEFETDGNKWCITYLDGALPIKTLVYFLLMVFQINMIF